jgi:hypothetical protein
MANLSNINNRFIVSDAGHVSIGNVTTNTYLVHAKSSAINNAILALESSSWSAGASAELRLSYVAGHERSIKGGYSTGLEFYTNNATPAITILPGGSASGATGNVGIGTDSPSAKFQVNGEGLQGMQAWFGNGFINNANYHYSFAKVGFSNTDPTGTETGAGFQFNTRNSSNGNWMHGYIYQPQDGGIAFGTGGAGTIQATERMRINSGGNVNILNATATDSKHIGITNAAGTTGWTFGNGVIANTHQFVIYDNTAGSARMLIDSSGNVGIRTTPQTTLADFCTIEIGNIGMIMSEKADSQYNSMFVSSNAYYASGWKRKTATVDGSTYMSMYLGGIRFGTAPQGAADSAITWTNQLIIANNGNATFAGRIGAETTLTPVWSVQTGTSAVTIPNARYLNFNVGEINYANFSRGFMCSISDDTAVDQPKQICLIMNNNSKVNNTFSPGIVFGSQANSGNYCDSTAMIAGRRLGQTGDSNWSAGQLWFWTATAGAPATGGATQGLPDGYPAMVINEYRRVMIGTNTASTAGQPNINQALQVATGHSNDGIIIHGNGSNDGMTGGGFRKIGFRFDESDESFESEIRFVVTNAGAHGGQLEFWTDNSSGTKTRAMTIDKSQNVGIGTDTPDFALDIEVVDAGVQLQIGRTNTNVGSAWMGASGSGFAVGVGAYGAGNSVTDPNGFLIDASGNLSTRRRIQAKTDTGVGVAVTRNLFVAHGGSGFDYTFDPVALFGAALGGGKLLLEVTGWPSRLNCGYIVWRNDGNGSGLIGTGVVSYVQTAVQSAGNVAVSLPSTSTNEIKITFTGWHTNDHGWSCYIKNDF